MTIPRLEVVELLAQLFANIALSSKLPEIRFSQLAFLDFEREVNFVPHYSRF